MAESQGLADHTTSFIRNEWYVAVRSDEIRRELLERQLLGVSVVFFRTSDGTPVALRNRCPHRSFPLSKGQLQGDSVVCGYHGLAFGADGACVEVPSQSTVPAQMCTRSYPLVERGPFLWIWMGDADQADPVTIPDHRCLMDPEFASYTGYMHCRTNYVRLHENVLDLTHFPYVHGEALGGLEYIRAPFKVELKGNTVLTRRWHENHEVHAGAARSIGNAGHRVNRTTESWFKSPAFHIAHMVIEDLEGGIGGRTEFNFFIIHCFTPETAHTTHYFYANARDTAVEDMALTLASEKVARDTFMEDEAALELVERTWTDEDDDGYLELSVRSDLAGLHMRRIIARRAEEECSGGVRKAVAELETA